MKHNSKKTLAVAIFGISALVIACEPVTPKAADAQDRGELSLPEAPLDSTATPFLLTNAGASVTYQPQILIWNAAATPAMIQRVGDASVEGRRRKSAMRTFQAAELKPARDWLPMIELTRSKIAVEITTLTSEQAKVASIDALTHWFTSRTEALVAEGVISDEDARWARTHFEGYCEYKIWELATSSLILDHKFASRPTPLQMCEPYYAREDVKLLDKSSGVCADAEDGKSFFACLWQEGVLKTRLYKSRIENEVCSRTAPQKKGEAISGWLASGVLESVLRDAAFGETARAQIAKGKSLPSTIEATKACRLAFQYLGGTVVPGSWENASLEQLKTIVETTLTGTEAYTLLPGTDDAAVNKARFDRLGTPVLVFAQRNPGQPEPYSVNDTLFNQTGDGAIAVSPTLREAYESSRTTDFSIVEDAKQRALETVPSELAGRLDAADAMLTQAKVRLAELDARDKELFSGVNAILKEGVDAVFADGAAITFLPFNLTVKKNVEPGRGDLQVKFRMPSGSIDVVGCVPVAFDATCSTTEAAQAFAVAEDGAAQLVQNEFKSLSYDAAKAELKLEIALSDPEALGLGYRARSKDSKFSEIPTSELVGRTLKLTVWPNHMGDALDFVTGKIEIVGVSEGSSGAAFESGGESLTRLYEGSFSGDDFGTRK